MAFQEITPFLEHFAGLDDPRTRESDYPLRELLLVAVCAVLSGADNWVDVADWGRAKLGWLRRFLPFAHGTASHDTFGRVFALLDAAGFEACFIAWMGSLCPALKGVVAEAPAGLEALAGWRGLKTLVKVESRREINGQASFERRYYLSSRQADAADLGQAIRDHWGIENGLHWSLDVAYGEDQARMRVGNAAENFSILRRITLNLIRLDQARKTGIKNCRLKADWDDAYRQELLGLQDST